LAGAPGQERVAALDGLRGWAALSVVVYHCLWQTFGSRFPETHNFITSLLGNGIMAVAVFLTISGYVLTLRRWRNPVNPPLYIAFARRYVRLTIPILAATLLVFALMSLDLTPTRAAHQVTEVKQWYSTFVRFEADLLSALGFACAWTYTWPAGHNYNPFLWTMIIELWGSFALFALSQNNRFTREPYSPLLLLGALALVVFPLAACFFAGALFALMERDGVLPEAPGRLLSFIASCGLLALITIGTLTQMHDRDVMTLSVVGTGVFLAARYSLPAQRFLIADVSQSLGRISFPLYLVQFAVIVSLGANLIVVAHGDGVLNAASAMLVAMASVIASLILATLFLPIELATLSLLNWLDRRRRAPRASVAARTA